MLPGIDVAIAPGIEVAAGIDCAPAPMLETMNAAAAKTGIIAFLIKLFSKQTTFRTAKWRRFASGSYPLTR